MRKNAFTVIELLVVVAIFLLMIAVLTPFVRMTKTWARRNHCADNLRRLSLGLHRYAEEHGDALPAKLGDLYPAYVADTRAFDCPATRKAGTPDDPDYAYTAGLVERSPADTSIAEDAGGNHGKSRKNVLLVNGSIEWVKR